MKQMNITIDMSGRDDFESIESDIVAEAARQLVYEVFNNRYEHHGKTFKELVSDKVVEMIEEYLDEELKESVSQKAVANVTDRLTSKIERTKIYKEAIAGQDIQPDAVIKSGLRDIIAEVVRTEMKKAFK